MNKLILTILAISMMMIGIVLIVPQHIVLVAAPNQETRTRVDIRSDNPDYRDQEYIAHVQGFELSDISFGAGDVDFTVTSDCGLFVNFVRNNDVGPGLHIISEKTHWEPMPITLNRMFVYGNQLLFGGNVIHMTGTELTINTGTGLRATLRSDSIRVHHISLQNNRAVDLMIQGLEIHLLVALPDCTPKVMIELSEQRKIIVEIVFVYNDSRQWLNVSTFDWDAFAGGRWQPAQYTHLFPMDLLSPRIEIYQIGAYIRIAYETLDGIDRTFEIPTLGSTQAKVTAENQNFLQVTVAGTIADDRYMFTFTMLGFDGQVLHVLTLPRFSIIDWELFRPFLPDGTHFRVIAISGNMDFGKAITQNTVWRAIPFLDSILWFQLGDDQDLVAVTSVVPGQTIRADQIPDWQGTIPDGYFFNGWFSIDTRLTTSLVIWNDMTFRPSIQRIPPIPFVIRFNDFYGNKIVALETFGLLEQSQIPTAPIRPGYDFVMWLAESGGLTITCEFVQDETFWAHYEINPNWTPTEPDPTPTDPSDNNNAVASIFGIIGAVFVGGCVFWIIRRRR